MGFGITKDIVQDLIQRIRNESQNLYQLRIRKTMPPYNKILSAGLSRRGNDILLYVV